MLTILFRGDRLDHLANEVCKVVCRVALCLVGSPIRPKTNTLSLKHLSNVSLVSGIVPAETSGNSTIGRQYPVAVEETCIRRDVLANRNLMGADQLRKVRIRGPGSVR